MLSSLARAHASRFFLLTRLLERLPQAENIGDYQKLLLCILSFAHGLGGNSTPQAIG